MPTDTISKREADGQPALSGTSEEKKRVPITPSTTDTSSPEIRKKTTAEKIAKRTTKKPGSWCGLFSGTKDF